MPTEVGKEPEEPEPDRNIPDSEPSPGAVQTGFWANQAAAQSSSLDMIDESDEGPAPKKRGGVAWSLPPPNPNKAKASDKENNPKPGWKSREMPLSGVGSRDPVGQPTWKKPGKVSGEKYLKPAPNPWSGHTGMHGHTSAGLQGKYEHVQSRVKVALELEAKFTQLERHYKQEAMEDRNPDSSHNPFSNHNRDSNLKPWI